MAHLYTVLDVFDQDCHLVLKADHFNPDGSWCYTEHHRHPGGVGLHMKHAMDVGGEPLLTTGLAATRQKDRDDGLIVHELKRGEQWAYTDELRATDEYILEGITDVHYLRLKDSTNWQGYVDKLNPSRFTDDDRSGCARLVAAFKHLIGFEYHDRN